MTRSDAASSRLDPPPASTRSRHDLAVVVPYRLDLTVSVLRRLATNVVDVLTPNGRYVRALSGAHGIVIVSTAQPDPGRLTISIVGDPEDHAAALVLARCMLAVDRDLTPFDQAAASLPWLRPLAVRMHGVKPPRYGSLWESFVNVVAFQQLSLQAASTIVRRLIVSSGPAIECDGVALRAFPQPGVFLATADRNLRDVGLSANKIATLRRAGEALVSGQLNLASLEHSPSPEAAALLQKIKGIGPWTASVILLRGLGRLDVFPMNDTSVAQNLALVAGSTPVDIDRVVDTLRPQQGLLYYHLLLARLEARAALPSDSLGIQRRLSGAGG